MKKINWKSFVFLSTSQNTFFFFVLIQQIRETIRPAKNLLLFSLIKSVILILASLKNQIANFLSTFFINFNNSSLSSCKRSWSTWSSCKNCFFDWFYSKEEEKNRHATHFVCFALKWYPFPESDPDSLKREDQVVI